MINLDPIDLIIIVVYFIAIVAIGIFVSRKHENAEDYFLAGRKMTWPFIGLSLFASNISSTTLVGLAGEAYSTGIAVFNYEWTAVIALTFYCWFFLPSVLRSQVFTMPEFLERRYDRRARTYFSSLTLILNIIVDTAGSLYAGALLIQLIFPDVPIWQTIAIIAFLAGLYTIAGGLAAVIYTDAIQAVLLSVGSVFISVAAYSAIGGWDGIVNAVPADSLSLIRPMDDQSVPWTGLISGLMILSFYFWCTNQFVVQRVLAAKNLDHGRWGSLFAAFLKLPVLFTMVLPGTMAIVLFPNLDNPDLVYPTLVFELLPVGLTGLVIAGFVAALMSQVDSTLNSASTLVTMDFVRLKWPTLNSKQLMRVGQGVTALFMILAAAWSPLIANFSSLFQYLQSILSYAIPPVAALFLIGLFWPRANAHGAFYGILLGTSAGAILFLSVNVFDWFPLHFLHAAPIVFAVTAASIVVGSMATPPPDREQIEAIIWKRSDFRSETLRLRELPWYQNYRVLSILLISLSSVIVASFW